MGWDWRLARGDSVCVSKAVRDVWGGAGGGGGGRPLTVHSPPNGGHRQNNLRPSPALAQLCQTALARLSGRGRDQASACRGSLMAGLKHA